MAKKTKNAATKTKKTVTAKKTTKKVVAKKSSKKTTVKKETTHILAILDRSGSMRPVINDAIGGYNTFLAEQKKLKDKATLSGMMFDDKFEELNDGKVLNIKDVPELTLATFSPRGSTALFDAIGKTVNTYKATKNNADKVLVMIITDGHENASREYKQNDIADLIKYQKTQNWQFVFLCSTEDAITVGASLGVSKGNTFKFDNTSVGNNVMYSKLSKSVESYRGMSASFASGQSDSLLSDEK
jgi:Mg-chelatase subunit ChlD